MSDRIQAEVTAQLRCETGRSGRLLPHFGADGPCALLGAYGLNMGVQERLGAAAVR